LIVDLQFLDPEDSRLMQDARAFVMRPIHHQQNTKANVCHLVIDMTSSAEG
jgi:hypothetical protein